MIKFTFRSLFFSLRYLLAEPLLAERRVFGIVAIALLNLDGLCIFFCSFLRRIIYVLTIGDAIQLHIGAVILLMSNLVVVYAFCPRSDDMDELLMWVRTKRVAIKSRLVYLRKLFVLRVWSTNAWLWVKKYLPSPHIALLGSESSEKTLLAREYASIINRHR